MVVPNMNNSFAIEKIENSVQITSGEVVLQFPINSLILVADATDVILLRTAGSRKNVAELKWQWTGESTKAEAIAAIAELIFA